MAPSDRAYLRAAREATQAVGECMAQIGFEPHPSGVGHYRVEPRREYGLDPLPVKWRGAKDWTLSWGAWTRFPAIEELRERFPFPKENQPGRASRRTQFTQIDNLYPKGSRAAIDALQPIPLGELGTSQAVVLDRMRTFALPFFRAFPTEQALVDAVCSKLDRGVPKGLTAPQLAALRNSSMDTGFSSFAAEAQILVLGLVLTGRADRLDHYVSLATKRVHSATAGRHDREFEGFVAIVREYAADSTIEPE